MKPAVCCEDAILCMLAKLTTLVNREVKLIRALCSFSAPPWFEDFATTSRPS